MKEKLAENLGKSAQKKLSEKSKEKNHKKNFLNEKKSEIFIKCRELILNSDYHTNCIENFGRISFCVPFGIVDAINERRIGNNIFIVCDFSSYCQIFPSLIFTSLSSTAKYFAEIC